MIHHRSPTHSYSAPRSIHATLALRPSNTTIPTLLSPLRSIANTPLDDFQSNAWISPSPTLTGLGITYLREQSENFHGQQDSAWRMQVDGDQGLLSLPAESPGPEIPPDGFPVSTLPYESFQSKENSCVVQNFVPSFCDEHTGHVALGLDNDIDPAASDIIGLIPDVNMYDRFRRRDLPHTGVNPLDTICSTSLHDIAVSYGEPVSLTPKDHDINTILSTTDSKPEQSPSPRVIQDIMSILVQPPPDFSFPPWPSANSPSAQSFSPSQLAAPRPFASIKLEPPHVLDSQPQPLTAPCNFECSNTTHLSPVFNAHLGIELGELISRAERFRIKYPERDIDRAWLSHFAGKLSDRGELLNDFRCYVIGCDQRNKRRDHILVHVGAHVGQRPFACSVWFVDSRLADLECQLNTCS